MKKGRKQLSVLVIILILLPTLAVSHHHGTGDRFFEDTSTEKFNHIIVHNTTGRVYIGAVNRIYQLSQFLDVEKVAVMGAENDSPMCPVTRVCHNEVKYPTDYYNKVLLVHPSENKLLSCGSLFQGVCTLHDLDDVSSHKTAADISVVANKDTASTVAFIAPGPDTLEEPQVLYVGSSYTGNGPYNADVPAVSRRSLDSANMLEIFSTVPPMGSKIFVNSLSRETYPITYVYGFSSGGFSYFVTVQKQQESYQSSSHFISKLVRICENDVDNFNSYTEVPLSCGGSEPSDYNLAQAAYLEKPEQKHGGSPDQDKLFVVFAKPKDGVDNSNQPSHDSALCIYSMSAVRRMFTQNIQHCHHGNGERGLAFISPNMHCLRTQLDATEDFCGLDVNTPYGGTVPIEGDPVLRFPGVLLSAVAASSTSGYPVVFLGTSNGHLKKVAIERDGAAHEYDDILIEEGSPINPDLVFDRTKDHIYVMTKNKVTMEKTYDCVRFNHSCGVCLSSGDPYCGWCLSENTCVTKKDCEEAADHNTDSSRRKHSCWLPYNSDRCYVSTDELLAQGTTGSSVSGGIGGSTATRYPGSPSSPEVQQTKLTTLQDIAKSMRNIDKTLRELFELQKRNK